jgi:hypothetical protein
MIQEYYRQMRKFGCNILAVVQQYDIIKDSAVRGAMIGNSKILSTFGLRLRRRQDQPTVFLQPSERVKLSGAIRCNKARRQFKASISFPW